jgi:hypothetical protein
LILEAANIYSDATNGPERAAGLQALAAAGALLSTLVLVGITAWYAALTKKIALQSVPSVFVEVVGEWRWQTGGEVPFPNIIGFDLNSLHPMPDGYEARIGLRMRNDSNVVAHIDDVKFELETAAIHLPIQFGGGQPPTTVEPYASAYVSVSADWLRDAYTVAAADPAAINFRATITLGSGAIAHSPWTNATALVARGEAQ